jgi:hypothetical protein
MPISKFLPAVVCKPMRFLMRVLIGSAALLSTVSFVQAAPVYFNPNTDFSLSPTTISVGGNQASYTFAFLGGSSYDVDAVSTGGTAQVNYFSFFGQEEVVGFQIDSLIGATGYPFKAFPTAAAIPYSIAEDFIGLSFALGDGVHFGFAETLGPTLVGYGYETQVNTPIAATERIGAVDVPEPLTLSLFGVGFAGMAALRRRRAKKA